MTTQYSPILKLALPVQGELSGTWGDVVNDNITSMVEQAVAGRAVIDTWTTNSHTLTTANGTSSEARCAMLDLTDTTTDLTGAGTVICPTASKIYIVKNGAGQSITVKTAAGSGVLIPNGRTTFLFCDGTNVVEALTHTTSLQLGTSTVVTAVLDEDNMGSNSPTSLATQQSIKAYVDAQVGTVDTLAEILTNGNTSGANDIIVTAGQKITVDTIDETTTGSGVTIDSVLLKDDVVNATDIETGSISANDGTTAATIANGTGVVTVPSAVLTTADINGGTMDGVVIGGSTSAAISATTVAAATSLNIAGTVTVTSVLDEDNMASNDPAGLATQQSIKAYVDAQVGTADTLAEVLANGNTTGGTDISVSTGDDITFADSSKAIFGAASDLQIYHDGSSSIISDQGTGPLLVRATDFQMTNAGGSQYIMQGVDGGAVTLYHAGNGKLATTSTGIDVTGTVTMDGGFTSADFSFGDNDKAIFGAGSDLQIYHDGSNSYIKDIGTGSLVIDVAGDIILDADGGEIFFQDSGVNNGRILMASTVFSIGSTENNGDVKIIGIDGGADITALTFDMSSAGRANFNAGASFQDHVNFGDNDKAVFGASDDLQIFHDASNSYIKETGTGSLIIAGDADIQITDSAVGEYKAVFTTNGAVTLYFDNASKFATTSTGVDITGTAVTDGVTVDGTLDIEEVYEKVTVGGNTGSGTYTFDTTVQGVVFLNTDQTANRTINFSNVNSNMSTGQSVTCTVITKHGSTAYYFNAYQVDGSAVTPEWSGGTAPTEGNADSLDVYTFTIIKTASATFTVLASQTQFA